MKKAALHTLGCKVNAYETEAMQELLEKSGYEIVPFKEGADIYIINTCTVTNIADRKSRQMLHKARKMNPDAIVVAAGCYVQARGEDIDSCVDIVIGNNKKKDLVSILEKYDADRVKRSSIEADMLSEMDSEPAEVQMADGVRAAEHAQTELIDLSKEQEYEELHVSHTTERTRAFIKIQDGCNQFCSYCIIPYARGRVRSRQLEQVVEEIQTLAEAGYKEVVLTGIHISSYGVDTGSSLLELIEQVHGIEGIERIRLGSLEPRIMTEDFIQAIAALPKICPHFHLSLQSGCDKTLKNMNRRYTAQEYRERCELLRKYFLNPALTTDVIVGFPGETEEDFEESMKFVDEINFYETHIFKYSRRAGTRADRMPNQVPDEIKALRSAKMLELNQRKQATYEEDLIGTEQEVLMEEPVQMEDGLYQVGHTKEYVKIGLKTEENLTNKLIFVKIESVDQIIH